MIVAAFALVALLYFLFGGGNGHVETITAARSDFAAEVSVAGTVVAAQEVDLGFSQSGRITSVNAQVGERVSQDDVLANIENGDLRAALSRAQAELFNAQTGTRAEEIIIAEAEVENAQIALVDAINNAYRNADDAVRTKTALLFNNPRTNPTLTFITESSNGKSAAEKVRKEIEDVLSIWKKEVDTLTPASDLSQASAHARTNLSEVSEFLSAVSTALNSAQPDAYSTQTEIDAYTADVATARASINTAQSSLTTAVAVLDQSKKNLALKQAGSTLSDIIVAEANVNAAAADLAKTIVTAPFDGIITKMDAKAGKIVTAGTPEISMISEGVFQIESYIPEVTIAQIQVGNSGTVYLDAYGSDVPFGASVIAIDPAETVRDGVSTYKTTLQFNESDPRIRSGMTANLTLTTQEKQNTIVVPQGVLIHRGEQTFVEVLVGEEIVEHEVTTGLTSLGQIEIISGLTEGEQVVLTPTP